MFRGAKVPAHRHGVMDRDLNAYRCAEPHGGCCQTSKIRPDNYFFAGAFFGELILGRSRGSIGARIAVGMGDQGERCRWLSWTRSGRRSSGFPSGSCGSNRGGRDHFVATKPPGTEDQVPTGPKFEKRRLNLGRRYEKYPSNTDLSQHALCCRVTLRGFFSGVSQHQLRVKTHRPTQRSPTPQTRPYTRI